MKILKSHKYLSLFLVLSISILAFGIVSISKNTDNTSSYNENPPLSYILTKLAQPTYFKVLEQVEGQIPKQKLSQIINSIIDKDQNGYEAHYPTENLGWVSLYDNDNFSTGDLNEVKENRDKQRIEAKNMLWKENISSYKVLSAKYYNQPCCSVGWQELTNQDWIGMARYKVELITKDSRKLKYNIEVTVSNPEWIEPGTQLEVRKWVITNISDKDLPELYKGMGI